MALMVGAPLAFADHGTIHDSVGDVKFNPPGKKADYDITRASWSVKHGRFIHTVSVRGRVGDPRTGFGPLPQLQIDVPNHGAAKGGCEYTVRAPAGGRGALSASGCPSRAAKQERGDGVSVKKVSRHTVKYKIREDVIGNPTAYQWRFDLPAKACRRCVYDRIPNNHDKWHILHHEPPPISPIQHVVVIYQENHSFDNVLGRLCVRTGRCDGAVKGKLPNGSSIRLRRSPDVVPDVGHTGEGQTRAINGGRMDGWPSLGNCSRERGYQCMTEYGPGQIPNLTRLARHFAISDRTFQLDNVSTWGAHLELVAGTLDGFLGNRVPRGDGIEDQALGWGCDSGLDTAVAPASTGGPVYQSPPASPTTRSTRRSTPTAAPTGLPRSSTYPP